MSPTSKGGTPLAAASPSHVSACIKNRVAANAAATRTVACNKNRLPPSNNNSGTAPTRITKNNQCVAAKIDNTNNETSMPGKTIAAAIKDEATINNTIINDKTTAPNTTTAVIINDTMLASTTNLPT